jgi:eukaryotic-like serine/threonine-protein kinase
MTGMEGQDMIDRLNAALEGRYSIEREVGEGGMATVYLANDLKHERRVALKVLKPELAAVVGAERFLAEIRTTANLQHPHILPLFDSGKAEGFLFYVMPYVEGESLRERLDREKQLPVDEAVRIARRVAGALDYAHRHDIIHRDIKPANILLHDGEPVVADFGIALAVQEAGGGRLTETGLSLGTPYYMSPEQATADRDPSAASDVYSLACVLYEMLAGEPPFTGSTAQAVLGRILTAEVRRPTEQRKSIPAHVEDALLTALEKLPADRFRSAAEFADALGDATRPRTRTVAGEAAGAAGGSARSALLPWALVAVLAVLATGLAFRPRAPAPAPTATVRAALELAPDQVIEQLAIAISDDGTRIALVGRDRGIVRLLTRELSEVSFTSLANTEDAELPFLSPDGSQVVFRAAGALRQVPTSGGPVTVVDADTYWAAGHWTDDGTLYYPRSYLSGLWRKRPDGAPEMLTEPDSTELAHWHPQLLPDGRHVLFTAFRTPVDSARIQVLDLESGERRTVVQGGVHGQYVGTGHLLYARGNTIFAITFDPKTLETSGRAVPIIDGVAMSWPDGLSAFDVSANGTAVYIESADFDAPAHLVWVDRDGRATRVPVDSANWASPALSPNGRYVAVTVAAPGQAGDVVVLDLVRGTRTPLTVGGGAEFQPIWSRDGAWVVFAGETPVFDLFRRRADGSGPAEILLASPSDKYPFSFAPDGSLLLFEENEPSGSTIRTLSMDDAREIEVLGLGEGADLSGPQVSPDGTRLAYSSDQSGRMEVYVASWPALSGRGIVSVDGGQEPRWTKGGRELVYRHGHQMLAVSVDPGSGELGTPQVLFEAPMSSSNPGDTSYDVTPDGARFLVVTRPPERAPRRVVVVTGFFEELRRRMGG